MAWLRYKEVMKNFLAQCRLSSCHNLSKKINSQSHAFLYLLLILFAGLLIYQQMQITALQEQIDDMNFEYGDGLGNKIYHLEYIQDSHTTDIYKTKLKLEKLDDAILGIQMDQNDLKWRIMQLEWEQK